MDAISRLLVSDFPATFYTIKIQISPDLELLMIMYLQGSVAFLSVLTTGVVLRSHGNIAKIRTGQAEKAAGSWSTRDVGPHSKTA